MEFFRTNGDIDCVANFQAFLKKKFAQIDEMDQWRSQEFLSHGPFPGKFLWAMGNIGLEFFEKSISITKIDASRGIATFNL